MAETTAEHNKEWSEVITPRTKLFDVRLGEVWRYRDLLWLFVKRDIAAQYKQTILGPIWFVIQPIFTTIVYFFLFTKVARFNTGAVPPPVFYMCGISIWNYFSTCFTGTANVFVSNANIFGKVYFPRLVLPLSIITSNMVKFGIQLCLLIVVIIYYSAFNHTYNWTYHFGPNLLLLPVILVVMAALGLGGGIIVSSLTTKYRDFAVLITFGMQLLMYVCPVAYSLQMVAEKHPRYTNLILSNPLSSLIEGFRYSVLGTGQVDVNWFLYSCGCTLVMLITGVIIFGKVERTFMDTV